MDRSYSIICKPVGASCNLNCSYCYYLEKKTLRGDKNLPIMEDKVLEKFIKEYLEINTIKEVEFIWQGGEPMLAGIPFYEKVIKLQKKYNKGKDIINVLQTNGTLIDENWCEFLLENNFLLGISVDGGEELHDENRKFENGEGSFQSVKKGIDFLRKYNIPFNILTVLNEVNVKTPKRLYQELKETGADFFQFIPLVERQVAPYEVEKGMKNAEPISYKSVFSKRPMADGSVSPEEFGDFYISLFNEWLEKDLGKIFIQFFEVTAGNYLKKPAGLCAFEPVCGHTAAIETNGDLYSCDHFVYEEYRLGNILEENLGEIMEKNKRFGMEKYTSLPSKCLECEVKTYCYGGCPKHRFLMTEAGERNLNYLCDGYYAFFNHAKNHFDKIF